MGIWIDILTQAAKGETKAAYELLEKRLPLVLRYAIPLTNEEWRYKEPLSDAVARFASTLPVKEQSTVIFLTEDLVTYIIGKMTEKIKRTLDLVVFCCNKSNLSLSEVAEKFTEWGGLKRGLEQKKMWVADTLRSMIAIGIPLPNSILLTIGDTGRVTYKFNELALLSRWDIGLSWRDFKQICDLKEGILCIKDSDVNDGVNSEGIDLGSITMAEVALKSGLLDNVEAKYERSYFNEKLEFLSETLGVKVTDVMEEMHKIEPKNGYRPIAWHKIFKLLFDEYECLQLDLEMHEPFCKTDEALAQHIAVNYPEVQDKSRPVIYRRQKKLHEACDNKIVSSIKEEISR